MPKSNKTKWADSSRYICKIPKLGMAFDITQRAYDFANALRELRIKSVDAVSGSVLTIDDTLKIVDTKSHGAQILAELIDAGLAERSGKDAVTINALTVAVDPKHSYLDVLASGYDTFE